MRDGRAPTGRLGGVTVEPVEGRRSLRAFLRFPEELYRGDPRWVPPLQRDERARLAPANPFFAHAEARLFLARRRGAVVGRVAAIVNRLHLAHRGDGAGFFGFFETVPDGAVAEALWGATAAWLRSRGLSAARGPVNPSTHDECGVLTDGFDRPPCLLMPYNPPYYASLLEGVGLRPIRELVSYVVEVPQALPARVDHVARAAEGRGIRVRRLDPRRLGAEAEVIRSLYNAAWGENWGALPMTSGEASSLASRLRAVLAPDLALIAESGDRPVGFILGLPDYNPALRLLRGRLTPWGAGPVPLAPAEARGGAPHGLGRHSGGPAPGRGRLAVPGAAGGAPASRPPLGRGRLDPRGQRRDPAGGGTLGRAGRQAVSAVRGAGLRARLAHGSRGVRRTQNAASRAPARTSTA